MYLQATCLNLNFDYDNHRFGYVQARTGADLCQNKINNAMILVTGATGQLGGAVIQQLLRKMPANQLVALTRDERKADALREKGVNIRIGSYDDMDSLDNAMHGVDRVLLIAGGDADNGLQQHQNVVDAAKKAGVQCIAYTSRSMANPDALANQLMVRHFQTEDYIKDSGLPYVLFRNILYMDTIPLFVGPNVLESGIALPAGQGKVSFALRSDMGEAIANVLADEPCENRTYNFTGASAYSFDDVAASLSTLSGKAVRYTPVPPDEFAVGMKQRGVPDKQVQRVIDFMTDIQNGQEEGVSHDLETILGRKPASLEEGLKSLFRL